MMSSFSACNWITGLVLSKLICAGVGLNVLNRDNGLILKSMVR